MEKPNIPSARPAWARCIERYIPGDALEAAEQKIMLDLIDLQGDALLERTSAHAHMTSSAMIVSRDRKKVLMAYHNIYKSWAWTGGHNDGDGDFLAVAMREAQEETGIQSLKLLGDGPASLEVLHVLSHIKRGQWVGTHLHLNVSFLFEADESEPLTVAQDENSAVGWLNVQELCDLVTEPHMLPIYERLLKRANNC